MEPSIFKFIFKHSRREQILLLLVTAASFPFLYVSLDLPKTIINEAIGGRDFPQALFGYELDQIPYLMVLCGFFLALVFINGGFKYFVNVYRGVVAERMLRRLRNQLFSRVLRFPLPHFRRQSEGEIVSMITAEAEPLGGFVGDSVALPAFQGGTLLTILVFMFVQDWVLGAAAIALYPMQGYLIPKLQRKVNELGKQRVVQVRKLSEGISQVVTGIQEIHAHDTSRLELADFSDRMNGIYGVRLQIFRLKFFIKFLNNFIDKLTPFFFFSIGGYLVIKGQLTFGALVAVLAAYKDISAPWKELLKYYQTKEDARIKYELLVETFGPQGMLDEKMQTDEPEPMPILSGELVATNLDLREEDEGDIGYVSGANFKFDTRQRVALLGKGDSGKKQLAPLLAGVAKPLGGNVYIGDIALTELPETVTGRRMAYVSQEPRLRSGSLRDNLFYTLKHRPLLEAEYDAEAKQQFMTRMAEAAAAGDSQHDINADWIDYTAAGVAGPDELNDRAIDVLSMVGLDEDVYQLGLKRAIDPEQQPELVVQILQARNALRDRISDPDVAPLVELFDRERYNSNMTIAENLLFGTPRDSRFQIENLSANDYMRKVLEDTGLMPQFIEIGRKLAAVMVDLFADVEPGSALFEQYSFIHADDLPTFQSMLTRIEGMASDQLTSEDRSMLLSLPFKLIAARHRLGLVDARLQTRLLEARHEFAAGLGEQKGAIEFFDRERYNPAISIQDNILFGRLAYGKPRAASTLGTLIGEIAERLGLRRTLIQVGLDHQVGIGASRLSPVQRQKIAIARAVLKRPDLLIIDEATAAMDGTTQAKVMEPLFGEFKDRGLIWVLHRASLGREFDHTLVLDGGKVVEAGRFTDLDKPNTVLKELVLAG